MLEIFSIAVAILSCVAVLVQTGFAIAFARFLVGSPVVVLPKERYPKAVVLLPLRGADTRLDETLRRLVRQEHPNYYVQLIIDSEKDPATAVAKSIAKEPGGDRLRLSFLLDRRTTCGLQCSALAQGVELLDKDVEHVVTIDGDVLTYSTWLQELVAPLEDEKVGATFGNRWFATTDGRWGSQVRHLWNAAAIVPMWLFGIPWGGSMGIRREILTENGLLEKWKKVMVHDAPVLNILKDRGLKIQFVPSSMIPIEDACGLSFCVQFLTRQTLWTKLYHPNFAPVVLHAVVTTVLSVAIVLSAILAIGLGKWFAASWLIGSVIAYLMTMVILLWRIDRAVAHVIERRGEKSVQFGWSGWAKLALAIPLTQFVYTWVTVRAVFANRITWRGVSYVIRSPFDVSLVREDHVGFDAVGRGDSL